MVKNKRKNDVVLLKLFPQGKSQQTRITDFLLLHSPKQFHRQVIEISYE